MKLAGAIRQRSGPHEGRIASAFLEFGLAGGSTNIARQYVPYPFHITRPFRLDAGQPSLSTLYLQSAAGGLYRGDYLALRIAAGPGSAAHVTTQSATIVHDTRSSTAEQSTQIEAQSNALLAFTPDPLILFSGAAYRGTTDVIVGEGSVVIVADGVSWHDPLGAGRVFAGFAQSTIVRDGRGVLLAADRADVRGPDLIDDASPLGPFRAFGTLFALGPADRLPAGAFNSTVVHPECLSATTRLPNGAGLAVRLLTPEGGALARCLEAAFQWAFKSALGFSPAPRRK